jgi:hypothetical protein
MPVQKQKEHASAKKDGNVDAGTRTCQNAGIAFMRCFA